MNLRTASLAALLLASQHCWAQTDLSALKSLVDRPAESPHAGNANERRAKEFEDDVVRWIDRLEYKIKALNITVEVPSEATLSIQEQNDRQRYRHGSMNRSQMTSYENRVRSIVSSVETQVSAKENAANRTRRGGASGAITTVTVPVFHQNSANAIAAELRIQEAEERARAATARAVRAEEAAKDADY